MVNVCRVKEVWVEEVGRVWIGGEMGLLCVTWEDESMGTGRCEVWLKVGGRVCVSGRWVGRGI